MVGVFQQPQRRVHAPSFVFQALLTAKSRGREVARGFLSATSRHSDLGVQIIPPLKTYHYPKVVL